MKDLPNFPLLFGRIGYYLRQPCAPHMDVAQRAAIEAFDEVMGAFYTPELASRCPDHPIIDNLAVKCPDHPIIDPMKR